MRKFKKILFLLIGLVVFLVVVAAVLPFVIPADTYKPQVIKIIEENLGKKVSIGTIRLSIITGLGLDVGDVIIRSGEGFKTPELMSVKTLAVRVAIFPLIRGEVVVSGIHLTSPHIFVEHAADGNWNYLPPQKPEAEAAPEPTPGKEEGKPAVAEPFAIPESAKRVSISSFTITDGQLSYVNYQLSPNAKPLSLSHLEVALSNVNVAQEMGVEVSVQIPGTPENGGFSVKGSVGPLPEPLDPMAVPLDLTVRLKDMELGQLRTDLAGIAPLPEAAGTLNAEIVAVHPDKDTTDLKVHFQGTGLKMGPAAKGLEVGLDMDGSANTKLMTFAVNALDIAVGAITIHGEGRVNNLNENPSVDIRLASTNLSLPDLLALAAVTGTNIPPEVQISPESCRLDVTAQGTLADLKASGLLDLSPPSIRYGESFAKEAGTPLRLEFKAKSNPSLAQLEKASFSLGQTEIVAVGTYTLASKAVDFSVRSPRIAVAELMTMARLDKQMPGGAKVSGDTTFVVSVKGTPAEATAKAELSLRDNDISLEGVIQKPAGLPAGLTIDTKLEGESLTLNDASIQFAGASLKAGGTIGNINSTRNANITIESNTIELTDLQQHVAVLKEMNLSGTIRAKGAVKGSLAKFDSSAVNGSVAVRNLSLRHAALPKPVQKVNVTLEKSGNTMEMKDLLVLIGSTDLKGSLTVANFDNPAKFKVTGKISSTLINLPELMPQPAGTAKAVPTPPPSAPVPCPPSDPEIPAIAKVLNFDGDMNLKKVIVDPSLTVENVELSLRLAKGIAQFPKLGFQTYGGKHNGSATVDFNGKKWKYDFSSQVAGLNMNQALSAQTSVKDLVYGTLNTNLELHGLGICIDDIKKNLNGRGNFALTNGEIKPMDFSVQLASVAQLLGIKALSQNNKFNSVQGSVTIQDGKISNDSIKVSGSQFDLVGQGYTTMDLDTNYDVDMVFNRETSEDIVNKVGVPQSLKTAEGLVKVPIKVSGPLRKPKIKANIDLGKVLQEKAKEEVKKQVGKEVEKKAKDLLKGLFK